MKNKWTTQWTGSWPCLCHGEWILYKNGEEMKTDIPFQENPASTRNTYQTWYFDEDWLEVFEDYEDGYSFNDWKDIYYTWLSSIAPGEEWEDIYKAFQVNDWRSNSCGGCI